MTLSNIKTGVNMTAVTNEVGLYRFEQVDPGLYSLRVESPGFSRFKQENFDIRASADVTVNAALNAGAVQETVTVEGLDVEIPFNTTNAALTIDTKMTTELPRFDRNPFKLTLLQPSAVETRRGEMNPYNTYAPNSVELGGGTNLKNDLVVDGSTINIGYKAAWVPNADSVQEATVQKNAVDASVGHSAGGTISIATKSGTNELHGSVYWLQRNPAAERGYRSHRRNFRGGPQQHFRRIRWEPHYPATSCSTSSVLRMQRPRTPAINLKTMPTALERTGDFSQSLNANGALRVIYDPYTTISIRPQEPRHARRSAGTKFRPTASIPLGAQWMGQHAGPQPHAGQHHRVEQFRSPGHDRHELLGHVGPRGLVSHLEVAVLCPAQLVSDERTLAISSSAGQPALRRRRQPPRRVHHRRRSDLHHQRQHHPRFAWRLPRLHRRVLFARGIRAQPDCQILAE